MQSVKKITQRVLEDMPSTAAENSCLVAGKEPRVHSLAPPVVATGASTAGRYKMK